MVGNLHDAIATRSTAIRSAVHIKYQDQKHHKALRVFENVCGATCDNVLVFGECSERDVRSTDVPNVDVEIEKERTARNVELALRSPADTSDGRDRLDVVGVRYLRWIL